MALNDATAGCYRTLTGINHRPRAFVQGWQHHDYVRDVDGHAAVLKQGNALLLEGLNDAGRRLLDVGCGEGAFSVWAAARGYTVTGCSLSDEHIALARELAHSQGVAHRCRFLIGDMDRMPFAPATFDVVVNRETWCHSQSKVAYLKGIRRLLRPGGVFRCVDLALGDPPASPRRLRQYQAVCEGFQIPSLLSRQDVIDYLTAAGFCDISVVDLTARVKRSLIVVLASSAGPHIMSAIGLNRWIYGADERIAGVYRRQVAACLAFNRGLASGAFRYLYVTARNP